jgi:hypothetical protein
MFSMTLFFLMTALLGVVYRHGSRRAFWLGSTLFGWIYWVLSIGPWFDTFHAPDLLLTRSVKDLSYVMHPEPEIEGRLGWAQTPTSPPAPR